MPPAFFAQKSRDAVCAENIEHRIIAPPCVETVDAVGFFIHDRKIAAGKIQMFGEPRADAFHDFFSAEQRREIRTRFG